ncbi:MAG: Rieske (2Fe-2S) protein [Thermomicrobiales bacterium]|nr:Rieske (2Fe-2S) protein [Thermomicrobiales bacterium]
MVNPPADDGRAPGSPQTAPTPASDADDAAQRSSALYHAHWAAHRDQQMATRRRVLRWVIRIGAAAFSAALLLPALAIRVLTRGVHTVAAGDTLVYASGSRAGSVIAADALAVGAATQAFPQGKSADERNIIELVRIGPGAEGLVAYSAICTHLGCTVAAALNDQGDIHCPCHGSIFDPAHDARVVRGPAGRPLPSLPVQVSADGQIVATGGFSGPIGPT